MRSAMNRTSSGSGRIGFSGKTLTVLGWMGIILVLILIHQACQVDADPPRTITVDDDGEGDYETIQHAIDNASQGDTIRVWEGIYCENVVVNKTLNLVGNGSGVTIIDGVGNFSVVKTTADWVNVTGFHITGGGRKDWEYSGIEIESDNNTISLNNVSDNEWFGILIHKGADFNNISENVISFNEYHGVFVRGSFCIIYGNTIYSNREQGMYVDGLTFEGPYHTVIQNNSIYENDGGILLLNSCYSTVIHNTLDRGISVSDHNILEGTTHIIEYNTIHGKPIYYYKNEIGISIPEDAGSILLMNCSDIKISGFNLSMTGSNIQLDFCRNITISNNSFLGFRSGISLWYSNDCLIQSNTLDGGWISLAYESNNNIVRDNLITSGTIAGISLHFGACPRNRN